MGLVLDRRAGERVCIGEDGIEMEVISISPGKIRLMFEAPDSVVIDREEVRRRKERKVMGDKQRNDAHGNI